MNKEKKDFKTFLISISITIAFFISSLYLGAALRTRNLIYDEIMTRARANFHLIVLSRKWNAHYGGVYVEKKKGIESNPYLENPDIVTRDGTVYTKKNPALMMREISDFSKKQGYASFNITSLNPLNPNNQPDSFEKKALYSFENGVKEKYERTVIKNRNYFRYMAPLHVEEACLQCHAKQGYKVGDIRGGISILLDIENIHSKLRKNIYLIIFFSIASVSLLLGVIYLFTNRLIRKLVESRQKIEEMVMSDELTGIFNRRHSLMRFGEEFQKAKRFRSNLSCVMIDIDHFKNINDNYGHLIGDKVLKDFSLFLSKFIRAYDILGRYGGEEFLIVLPDTDLESTKHFAERLRREVREMLVIKVDSYQINLTISLGVASLSKHDNILDDVLKRADDGLYKAKNTGRDRVAWIEHKD
jgi:diguanylate cyclase (GGDEF)-like protein